MDRLRQALDQVQAEERLKENTMAYIRQELARRKRVRRGYIALAAMLALVVISAGSYGLFRLPVSFISIDVNPSVELALNCLDRVVEAKGYNEDGTMLLQEVRLQGKRYQDAIELLLAAPAMERVLDEDALVSFTVVSDREEELVAGIQRCRGYGTYASECHEETQTLLEEAHECNMSVGKYRASLELMEQNQSLTLEDCREMTMGEIRRQLRAGASPESPEPTPDTSTKAPEYAAENECDGTPSQGSGQGYGPGDGSGNGQGYGPGDGSGNGQGYGQGGGQGYGQSNGQGNGHGHGRGHGG